MKIPETTANVGAYYGNEENGQWQPNGVIIDSGVGGGVVGSGDAGLHRPPVYPLHIPRGHVPAPAGFVMAGAYYPAPYAGPVPPGPGPQPDDFEDYMWMENEEEFDKQVMQQLEEEALMEQCIEAMLEDEQRERQQRPVNGHNLHYPTTSGGAPALLREAVSRSTLNPLAAEFVPTRVATHATHAPLATEEKQDTPEIQPTEEAPQKTTEKTTEETTTIEPQATTTQPTVEPSEPTKTEEHPSAKDPPEVSAADVQPITEKGQEKRPKDVKKEVKPHPVKIDVKKAAKPELKPKAKPQVVKSETKVQPKKKEVKTVKSETKAEEKIEEVIVPVIEAAKPQPTPSEAATLAPSSGFKPINYAAAAKANKPKKPSPPPATDKPAPPAVKAEKIKTIDNKVEKKTAVKSEKPVIQRKNSAK